MLAKNEHNRIVHFVLVRHFDELCFCLLDPVSTATVDNVDQTVLILVVMMPQRAELVPVPEGHTVKLKSLYSTVSTLDPIVAMVITISPRSWSFQLPEAQPSRST